MKIIAESAFNHNGDFKKIIDLAKAAKFAKADIFTVQIFNCENFCIPHYSKYEIYRACEISQENWLKVFAHCREIEIEVLPCVLDESSFIFAYNFGFRFFKIHATDITNVNFLELLASKNDIRIFLETQCATVYDIRKGLTYIGDKVQCIVQGFSNYPTDYEDLNLGALNHMKNEFGLPVGLADHSLDQLGVPVMALAMGCTYLEKHITLSRADRLYDWQVSLTREEFSNLVSNVRIYEKAIGKGVKHPVKNELPYRNIMYKKVNGADKVLRRSDIGLPYLETKFNSFSRDKVLAVVIARLKSQRLKKKVLLDVEGKALINALIERVKRCSYTFQTILATSNLEEDDELASVVAKEGYEVFRGHPVSVLDRMLAVAEEKEAGAIFRITGDNLFTDPGLMDLMTKQFVENELDYVRVNNVPFGVSCELFATSYLWRLYINMDNPLESEYLTWFVIQDDQARKGCVDFIHESDAVPKINLSIDYESDYKRSVSLLKRTDKPFLDVSFKDVIKNIDLDDYEKSDKEIKLPQGVAMKFSDYLKKLNTLNYLVRHNLNSNDLHNW